MSKKNILISVASFCFFAFLAITIYLKVNNFNNNLDYVIRDFVYDLRGEKFEGVYWFFRIITEFGFYILMAYVIIFSAIINKFDRRFWYLGLGTLIVFLINFVIKLIFDRERPLEEFRWVYEKSSSFPSSHSMVSAFVYTFSFYLVQKSKLTSKYRIALSIFCLTIIPLICFSRIILGVHYFTDVICGLLLGICLALIAILIFDRKKQTQP